jgi:hypothetical protein
VRLVALLRVELQMEVDEGTVDLLSESGVVGVVEGCYPGLTRVLKKALVTAVLRRRGHSPARPGGGRRKGVCGGDDSVGS